MTIISFFTELTFRRIIHSIQKHMRKSKFHILYVCGWRVKSTYMISFMIFEKFFKILVWTNQREWLKVNQVQLLKLKRRNIGFSNRFRIVGDLSEFNLYGQILENSSRFFPKFQFWTPVCVRQYYWKIHPNMDKFCINTVCVMRHDSCPKIIKLIIGWVFQ